MSNTRTDLADGIHDVFRAEQPALYNAIVALLEAGAEPEHVTRFIDRECRRARGGVAGLTENAAAVTIEVLVRRRAELRRAAEQSMRIAREEGAAANREREEIAASGICPDCSGHGVDVITDDVGVTVEQTCETCGGSGRPALDPFGGSVLDEPRPVTAADEAALDVERRREWAGE
jgi:hypothetical protein